jgi:hypothetical protein
LSRPGNILNRDAGRWYALRANLEALAFLILLAIAVWAVTMASAGPGPSTLPDTTRLIYAPGKIVPLPQSVPHEAGDMVDRRIVPDLVWLAQRFPIYVTDGYSGPLPSGKHAGCDECHTRGSDHYNGLAVDLVPVGGGTSCDAKWLPITRLAHWAEPVQEKPRAPFRWVGYEGDSGHGCGNHLHLSWNHATVGQFQIAEWVEVFPATVREAPGQPEGVPVPPVKPPVTPGPPGGLRPHQTGGVSARAD